MLTTSDEKLAERLLHEEDTLYESSDDVDYAVGQRRYGCFHKHTLAVISVLSLLTNLLFSFLLFRQAWNPQQATNEPIERTIYGKVPVPLRAVCSDFN